MSKTKITTLVGTRPELIRLSNIIKKFDTFFDHRLIYTNQNFHPKLFDIFLDDLDIRSPDKNFNIEPATLGVFLGNLLIKFEQELEENPPHGLVVLGDTNSALASMIAKRRGIPIYHLEAGNRSFDANVPEEINRKILDHFADFNLAYTDRARENLLREGLNPRNMAVIGSPLYEVITSHLDSISSSNILEDLKLTEKKYFLVSAHRQENIDDLNRLATLIESINMIAVVHKLPVIVSLHPRSRSKLENANFVFHPLVKICDPFGFFDYCKLQLAAKIVLSDSGSVSEESVILGFPAITIRDSMERPEALESGSVLMSGIGSEGVLKTISILEKSSRSMAPPIEYTFPDSSTRIINFISSTIHLHSQWSGLRKSEK